MFSKIFREAVEYIHDHPEYNIPNDEVKRSSVLFIINNQHNHYYDDSISSCHVALEVTQTILGCDTLTALEALAKAYHQLYA